MQADVRVRPAAVSDARPLLELKRALDRETEFMMLEPDERTETEADLARHLDEAASRGNSAVFVAEAGTELLGYVEAEGGSYRRNAHSAYVVIGVRSAAAGRGIGKGLLRALDSWAVEHGVHRLELTVMAHNERAIALYRKCGYEVEGTRRDSIRLGGRPVDELAMAKLL